MQPLTPSAWARRVGLTPRQVRYAITAGDLDRLGLPPGGYVEQSPGPRYTILIPAPDPPSSRGVALYARVWLSGAGEDLDAQIAVLRAWAKDADRPIVRSVRELCGPFDLPERLLELVVDTSIPAIAITHRDTLGWLNAPFVSAILQAQGRELVDLHWTGHSPRDTFDLLDDFLQAAQRLVTDLRHRYSPHAVRPP